MKRALLLVIDVRQMLLSEVLETRNWVKRL
jgi:hypothetical protein